MKVSVAISESLAAKIANAAVRMAVVRAPKKTGKGIAALYPIAKPGIVGIGVRKSGYYMRFQEEGIRPFTMWSLEGKTIPIEKDGKVVFRKAVGVGKPGRISKRDPKTGRIMPGNVGVKWRHPGLEPKRFMAQSIEDALFIYRHDIAKELAKQVMDGLYRSVKEQ